jgi:hypothetical protein
MGITLEDIRNKKNVIEILNTPAENPLYDFENDNRRNAARGELRDRVRRARSRFIGASLIGEMRKIAKEAGIAVADVEIICSHR